MHQEVRYDVIFRRWTYSGWQRWILCRINPLQQFVRNPVDHKMCQEIYSWTHRHRSLVRLLAGMSGNYLTARTNHGKVGTTFLYYTLHILKLRSLFAALLFRTSHTKSHNMKALAILSHSWSPFLPLTCLYGRNKTFVGLWSICRPLSIWGLGFESLWGLDSGHPIHGWEGKRLPKVIVILHELAWLTGA